MPPKYIVVTGGVISGLGKGITSSSIGTLLVEYGLKVTAVKIDPYLNVDSGLMSPFEHGETFVLEDGGECDLDLGNYERFLGVELSSDNNLTTGKIYQSVIQKERRGEYLGKTVQIVPHVTNCIKDTIAKATAGSDADVCLIELGGTIGDIEGMPFVEALRQFQDEQDVIFLHLSLIVMSGQEPKTKPTQMSIRELHSRGIRPQVVGVRTPLELDHKILDKLSLFCQVPVTNIIQNKDVPSVYHVPLAFEEQNVVETLARELKLELPPKPEGFLSQYKEFTALQADPNTPVTVVGIVGKYVGSNDTYISVVRSLEHAAYANKCIVKVDWIDSEALEALSQTEVEAVLGACDSLLVPGGFGTRGIEGIIQAVTFARVNKVPLFGICLGMQLMVVEIARTCLGLTKANSVEIDAKTPDAVVMYMPEQKKDGDMGATMRLGGKPTVLKPHSLASSLYNGATHAQERHRHRYEVNPAYVGRLEEHLIFSGTSTDGKRMEVIELLNKPAEGFYFGVQYHPEFKSRLEAPHPVFAGFVAASLKATTTTTA